MFHEKITSIPTGVSFFQEKSVPLRTEFPKGWCQKPSQLWSSLGILKNQQPCRYHKPTNSFRWFFQHTTNQYRNRHVCSQTDPIAHQRGKPEPIMFPTAFGGDVVSSQVEISHKPWFSEAGRIPSKWHGSRCQTCPRLGRLKGTDVRGGCQKQDKVYFNLWPFEEVCFKDCCP